MKRRDFLKYTSVATAGFTLANMYGFSAIQESGNTQILIAQRKSSLNVIADVDVLVVGGASGGVAAAVKAAQAGASVFLVASEPYLGYDICGMQRFWELDKGVDTAFRNSLFRKSEVPEPAYVKRMLQDYLITNNIDFLLSSYAGGVIVDNTEEIGGVVIVNRGGEQIIKARTVIDATDSALVAKLLGSIIRKVSGKKSEYRFTVIGNQRNPAVKHKVWPDRVFEGKNYPVTEYSFSSPVDVDSFDKFQLLEQSIRDKSWDADQVDSSDLLFEIPVNSIAGGNKSAVRFRHIDDLSVKDLNPVNRKNLFVLNGYADIDFRQREEMLLPGNMIAIGEMLGSFIGENIDSFPVRPLSHLKNRTGVAQMGGVGLIKNGLIRPDYQKDTFYIDSEKIPIIGSFDNVVVGGGTAGACAAISSARYGSRTLVIEYLHGLGGIGTMGLIGRYWVGYRNGFTREIDDGVAQMASSDHPRQRKHSSDWVKDWKMEWYRSQILKAGGKVWFGIITCGAVVEGNTVKGVVVSTPFGKGVVLAKNVIDSTGSADIAIAAGAAYQFVDANSVAMQGSGLPMVNPDNHYNNSDYTFIDDTDVFDVTRTFVSGAVKFKDVYDIGKLPQTRERRRIIGDYTVTAMDMANGRFFEDTLSYHYSSFDTHGYTVDPYFIIKPPADSTVNLYVNVPLRALLPKGLNQIIVTGLGVSAERDAMPIIRMQPCLQNQGYSVGYIAALSSKKGVSFRELDFANVQTELIHKAVLPEKIKQGKDMYPPSNEQLREAVRAIVNDFEKLELVLWDKERGLEILKEEYDSSKDPEFRIKCAVVLGFYGFNNVVVDLIDAIQKYDQWDKGWNYRGMHQFGMSASYLDALIMSLGKSGSHQAYEQLSRLAGLLTIDSELSHFRAISEALADMKHPQASFLLYRLLNMPGIMGHSVHNHRQVLYHTSQDVNDNSTRNLVLKELFLARALFICGDYKQLGREVLEKYTNDLCGTYSAHARAVLKSYSVC